MAKWLAKANDDILSFCECIKPLASAPGQFDCPWCGCGWLIPCVRCGKSFVFAEVIETDQTYAALARNDLEQRGLKNISNDDVIQGAAWMQGALEPLQLGSIVVYLDGLYFPVDQRNINLEGEFASHEFDRLPHAVALEDKQFLNATLGNVDYWLERERPDRDNGD